MAQNKCPDSDLLSHCIQRHPQREIPQINGVLTEPAQQVTPSVVWEWTEFKKLVEFPFCLLAKENKFIDWIKGFEKPQISVIANYNLIDYEAKWYLIMYNIMHIFFTLNLDKPFREY